MQIAFLDAFLLFLYNFQAYLITSEDFSSNFFDALHHILLTGQAAKRFI